MGARYYSDMADYPTCVYRLYAANDALLYVGLSMNPLGRYAKHRCKPWGKDIAVFDEDWYPDRESAKAAEKRAIHDENPIYNITRPRLECC